MEILAHRGASGTAPENTIAAFKKALVDGCDGFEFDVQQTKDGEIVVFHDWTLERTSNGNGYLRDHTLEELKKLDVGSWFNDNFKGEKIPTLEETLNIIPDDKLINIELKEEHSIERGTEKKVLDIIKKYPTKNIIVSSFSHNLLKNLKELDNSIKVGILLECALVNLDLYIENLGFKIDAYHPGKSFLNKKDVDYLNSKGIDINVWTVNTTKDFNLLKDMGVTRVITNFPKEIRK
ncbi:glycerophosphodiester phosphodiesterase [Cetobacterium somerae]|uniref:glycerophosphodiester phosphodiesterase n=1 Tax=Cetobacterium sp. NK01 TaxID=2993530 RepID=UPI0021161943|nr:glycerophosphodiester phosphodiesterase [Cetobacterium sp. NK01]MCQ8211062.1 glycerophosphodiester phosphodiesterase [Cetobacterium sp. NK01]